MWNKITICVIVILFNSNTVFAEPLPAGIDTGGFTYVSEGLPEYSLHGPVWCYDDEANSVLITSAPRAVARCKLEMEFEIEKQKIKHELRISNLNLRVKSLIEQQESILSIKDEEINRLMAAALQRPNSHVHWWAIGGFATGMIITVLTVLVVQGDI